MRTTFGSFNIATTGLFASQRALDIASHNITNANTEGFSRQYVSQRATMPMIGDPTGVVGTGTEVYDIKRVRSEYLDQKYWGQNRAYNEWQTKQTSLEELEGIFNEPSDTGIRKVMDDFFVSLEELSKKPGDSTNRVAVIEKANTLVASINRNGVELVNAARDINFSVKNKVEEINSLGKRIANLNKQIFNFELDGHKANDLRDQRTVLVDELSNIINISVKENPGANGNNYFSVSIGGVPLVDHIDYRQIDIKEENATNATLTGITDLGGGKISQLVWKDMPDQQIQVLGGELKGMLDIRDGDGVGTNYRGIPYYLNKLNTFTQKFAEAFNAQHKMGTDLNGNAGVEFFSLPTPPHVINCVDGFKVNQNITNNPNLIAASSAFNGESNNDNIKKLIEMRQNTTMFMPVKGTPDDFIKSILAALSVDSSQAKRMTENADAMVQITKTGREANSSVSLDEEMANMVKFQQAYNAAAKNITTLDKIMDTTINRLGLVGR